MHLGPHQSALLARAARLARAGSTAPPGLLLIGPPGCGKRTIARALAAELGAKFVSVSLADPVDVVRELLAGRPVQSGPSGLLGLDTPTVLYLDSFHAIPPGDLRLLIHRAVELRDYTAADGIRYGLAPDLFLLAGLRHPTPDAVLSPNEPLCTAFRRLDITAPADPGELVAVAATILDRLDPGRPLGPDVIPVVLEAARGADGLRTLEAWLREAVNTAVGIDPVTADGLRAARDRDVDHHLSQIIYRGRRLSRPDYLRWLNQFPPHLHPLAVDLIRQIATRYYISEAKYWDTLDRLLERARFQQGERVVFCKWQATGKSAPRVLNDLKNRCRFNPQPDLDVTGRPEEWGRIADGPPPTFVFVDDFIGTGRTVSGLWCGSNPPVPRLLGDHPGSRVVLLSLIALSEGELYVRNTLQGAALTDQVWVCVGQLYGETDRCLSDRSSVIPDPVARARLKMFCEVDCKRLFPKKYRFGYEDSQSLVVFPHTVPNNSFAFLWYEQKG